MQLRFRYENQEMDAIKSNFILFAGSRSGSSLLTHSLNVQKNIHCESAIFKPENMEVSNIYKCVHSIKNENFIKLKKLLKNKENFLENRNSNWKEYINIISQITDKTCFGYKIQSSHIVKFTTNEEYFNFLKQNNSKIIHLTRANILAQYISIMTLSFLKEKQTGSEIFSSKFKSKHADLIYKLNPINISYKEYIKYKQIKERNNIFIKSNVKKYDLPYLHLTYENITGVFYKKYYNQIFSFLKENFTEFIDIKKNNGDIGDYRKINTYNIKDKIINYTEFKKAAEDNNDIETLNFLKEA